MTQSYSQVFDRPVTRLKISLNEAKLTEPFFYHLIFAPSRKVELHELPIPYIINDMDFNLVDLAISRLVDIDPMLPLLSHGMSYNDYIAYMIRTYPNRANADTKILICKFEREISNSV